MQTTSAEYCPNIFNNLSSDKKNKISLLKEVLKNHSDQECFNILDSNLWNIEAAIDGARSRRSEATISTNTGLDVAEVPAYNRILPRNIANEIQLSEQRERIYYTPIISKDLHPWLYNFIRWTSSPFDLAISSFNLILKYIFFWKKDEESQEVMDAYESELIEILTSALFIPHFETGSVSFFLGNFEEAVAQAKHEYKFLLIYLHRLGNSEANDFLYDSFLNSHVVNLLNDPENMLIWAGHLSNQEGKEVSCLFHIPDSNETNHTEYFYNPLTKLFENPSTPFLFALLTVTNLNGGTKMRVVGQLERPVGAYELTNILEKWIEIGSRPRLVAKREKMNREASMDLRKVQEIAFNEMLEKDRKKEALLKSEIEERNSIINMKNEIRNKLLKMANDQREDFSGNNKNISLLIKMHNGRRFNWIFSLNSSVKYLYYLVYSQEDAPENFELLWNYPQKVLNCKAMLPNIQNLDIPSQHNDPKTFEEIGVTKNEIILVRDLDV